VKAAASAALLLMGAAGCGGDPAAGAPHASTASGADARGLFVLHDEAGVDFAFAPGGTGRKHLVEITAAGVALLDYDRDGDLDLFLPQGAALPGHPGTGDFRDRLWRNDGGWRFTDVTAATGVSDGGHGLDDYTYAAACPDFDGDGDPDLYLCNVGRNRFLRNDGGRFVDATAEWGGDCDRWSTAAAFVDFDSDRDLDLYVVNYVHESLDHPGCGRLGEGERYRSYCHPDEFPPADDALYRNDDGHLVDVSAECGVVGTGGAGLGAVLSDYDDDGDVDLFVANDSTPNFLWRNDGAWHFAEVAHDAWVAVDASGLSTAAMGTDFGDVDGDGDFDLIVANLDMEPNTLYVNGGHGEFEDRSAASGLGPPSLRWVGFGCEFADLDLDGDLDCLVANGHVCDNIELLEPTQTFKQPPHCYVNDGTGRFTEIGAKAGAYFEGRYVGRGLATGDLDGDGDLDGVIAHWDRPPALLENTTLRAGTPAGGARPRWLSLRLVGRGRNRDALGARVTVEWGGKKQVEELRGTSSYAAWHGTGLLFGSGATAPGEATVEVRWPDGQRSRHGPLAVDRVHELVEPE
jgi:hypothetical protein